VNSLTEKQLRDVQLELLDKVNAFCEQRGIRYYLHAGTLLGAVRHQGYIPWDDDIDLVMFREDYERFCREFSASLASEPAEPAALFSVNLRRDYGLPYAKVVDTRTQLVDESRAWGEMGVFIDVFPLDAWPDGDRRSRIHRLRMAWRHGLAAVATATPNPNRSYRKALGMTILGPLVRNVMSHRRLARGIERAARAPKMDTASMVGVTVFSRLQRVERDAYGNTSEVQFEGRRYPAPSDVHRVLECHYGDYMTLPPEEERIQGWHGIAVWSQINRSGGFD